MDKLAIIGAGDLGQQIAYHAHRNGFTIVGYYDDMTTESAINGIPVLGPTSQIETDYFQGSKWNSLACGIGYKHFSQREGFFDYLSNKIGIPFATIVDRTCIVDPTARIGTGSILLPGVLIDKDVVIDNNVLVNIGVTISHNTHIKSHSFLAPRSAIAGFSTVGKRCLIGIHSTIIEEIKLADDIRLGAGAVVIEDLGRAGLYVGVPARRIKD